MDKPIPEIKNPTEENEQDPETMEELLEKYDYRPPRRGEYIEGEIISVEEDSLLIDVGAKHDAVVPRKDLSQLEDEDLDNLEQGDKLPVRVMRAPRRSGELVVSVSKGLAQEDWDKAEVLLEEGEETELKVIGRNRGGLVVEFGYLEGFVPNSHLPNARRMQPTSDLNETKNDMVGDKMLLKVIEVDRNRNRLILSARAAEKERRMRRLQELEEGSVVTGMVVNLTDFGAFVALDGVDGLVHKSELSWDNVEEPSSVVSVGDKIDVKVKDVDVERERISLSLRALQPSPWDEIEDKYNEGDLVEGMVSNVVNFGAFITLPEGIEGLIHSSEMEIIGPGTPQDVVQVGDDVLVRIVSIEPDRHRMALSMKRVTYDEQLEWMENRATEQEIEAEAPEEEGEEEQPEAELAEQTEAEAEASEETEEPQAEVEVEAEVEAVVDDEAEAETEAQAEAEAEAETEVDAEVQSETAEAEAAVETEEAQADDETSEEEAEMEPVDSEEEEQAEE
ncbi:MAG: S1 RNA-binding domain-containing protein [Anaerolineales bacterium]|jgi:small subunit ribosomal protein S1